MSATARPYPILKENPYFAAFVTISGSHLYGFPSKDSDFDLRGAHVIPARTILGLSSYNDTFEAKDYVDGRVDCELVSHDIAKFFRLLLKNNGYAVEQVFSPLVVNYGILGDLRPVAKKCLTRRHYKHYCGFALNEWRAFVSRPEKQVKRILYVFRIILTGIHLLRTGEVESNLIVLNDEFKLPYIPELIEQKMVGYEVGELPANHGLDFYTREHERLLKMLEEAKDTSALPEEPNGKAELEALLLDLRRFV